MLDKELLIYPPRHLFSFNPGVPDRQLWAIGMIVVQWSITEFIRDQQSLDLIGGNIELKTKYEALRNARQKNEVWKTLVEYRMTEPLRSQALKLIERVRNLNEQRDDVIHHLWGDGALLRNGDEKLKTKSTDAQNTMRWRLTFDGLRKIALAMATLNRDLFLTFVPPGGPATSKTKAKPSDPKPVQ
jgi:hypothetical protein